MYFSPPGFNAFNGFGLAALGARGIATLVVTYGGYWGALFGGF